VTGVSAFMDGISLPGRYDDDRSLTVTPGFNHEITVKIGDQEPIYLDALDLLRAVSEAALGDAGWGWSPDRKEPAT